MPHQNTDDSLEQVRQALNRKLPAGWSYKPADLDAGIDLLRKSLDDYLSKGKDWGRVAAWLCQLAESITALSVALSIPWDHLPLREGIPATIKREAFLLAAVLVCNSCHDGDRPRKEGRPCSNVTLLSLSDADQAAVRALFKLAYTPSGLLG